MSATSNRRPGRPAVRVDNPDLERRLTAAARRAQHAESSTAAAQAERMMLVHEALADGWTHAQIARASGLTRSRVGQIALRRAD